LVQRETATGLEEAAAAAVPPVELEAAEPSGGPAARSDEVVDLTGVTSEGEDAAAQLGAAADEVVVETDQSRSEAPLEGAARDDRAADVPLEGVLEPVAAVPTAPTAAADARTWGTPALAEATVGVPAPPSTEASMVEAAAPAEMASGRTEPPMVSSGEQPAAKDATTRTVSLVRAQAPAAPELANAQGRSDVPALGWRTGPTSSKGKEPEPVEEIPRASVGQTSGRDTDASGSGSDDDVVWQEEKTKKVPFRLRLRREEEERSQMQLAVKRLNDALAEVGGFHQVRCRPAFLLQCCVSRG
jgi:hypothetical protein